MKNSGLFVKAEFTALERADVDAVFKKITGGIFLIDQGSPLPPEHPNGVTPLTTEAGDRLSRLFLTRESARCGAEDLLRGGK